jgi:hypothetical protein
LGKSLGNLETRAKTADQPGKVYKTVHPMTKRRTFREGQYLVQASSKIIKDALYGFISHTAR